MGSMSIWHWVIVALVIMLLFGKGRISDMMGDLAKGIKSFKQGMADDPMADSVPPRQVTQAQATTLQPMPAPVAQPAPVLSPDPSPQGAPAPDSTRP